MSKSKKKKTNRDQTEYAHNANFCMILPDPKNSEEKNISSTSQS